jgi:hypothetical protein
MVSNFPNKVRNSCLVYDDKGKQVARYDKIHLFGLDLGNEHYHEEKTFEAGDAEKWLKRHSAKSVYRFAMIYASGAYRRHGRSEYYRDSFSFYRYYRQGSLGKPDTRKSH